MSYTNDGFRYYRTPWPTAMPYEQHVPVPGWGMNPGLANGPRVGVGGIGGYGGYGGPGLGYDVPFSVLGQKSTLKIGIEDVIKKMATDAAKAAMPVVLDKASDALVDDVWPRLQPKLRVEMNYALAEAKKEVRRDLLIVVGALVLTGAAAAWWIRRG